MKTFKTMQAALRFAGTDRPILQIHNGGQKLFIALDGDTTTLQLTEVSLLAPHTTRKSYGYAGFVTLSHLNRLGNANHAVAAQGYVNGYDAFPAEEVA